MPSSFQINYKVSSSSSNSTCSVLGRYSGATLVVVIQSMTLEARSANQLARFCKHRKGTAAPGLKSLLIKTVTLVKPRYVREQPRHYV